MIQTFTFEDLTDQAVILDSEVGDFRFYIFKGIKYGPNHWTNRRHILGSGVFVQVTKFDKLIPFYIIFDGRRLKANNQVQLPGIPTNVKFIVDYDSKPKSRK